MKALLLSTFSLALLGAGCQASAPRVMTPEGMKVISWTTEETQKEIAVRHLRRTHAASHHLVRLAGAEQPHIHEHSDLTVAVLRGRVLMHLGPHERVVTAGQVIDIPRGTPHYAENLTRDASEAYVLFSPPLRKGDQRPTHQ